jgi:branched-chain amino acid transport system substrate-binding protein
VPSDRVTAETLASYLNQRNQQTAAVFYNSKSRYSDSLREQFRKSFRTNGREVIEFDLSSPFFNVDKAIDKAGKQGVKVLALFPNSQNSILNKTRKLINANQCRYSMVGGDTIYTPDILDEVGKESTKCLVVAVPWQSSRSPNLGFPQDAEKLWGGGVSWRTALTYDATRVLLAALENTSAPTRTQLQQTLSNVSFQATGATGKIRFQPNGDRKDPQIQLIQVQRAKQGQSVFVPLSIRP